MISATESMQEETLACPLCAGSGTIARREVLRLAGVDGVLDAVGPRIVELMDQRGLHTLTTAKEILEQTIRRDHEATVAHLRLSLAREAEAARTATERELERARSLAQKAHERSEKLAADFALSQKELGEARDELGRLRNTATKKGEAGEVGFVEAMKDYRHIRLSEKLASAGDYLLSVAVDEGAASMRVLESVALIDCKKDKAIGAGDVRKVAADARTRNVGVAFLVSATPRSKDPVDDVSQVDGVLVVTTTVETFVGKVGLLVPYLSLVSRLKADAGSTVDARQRLGELCERVVTKLKDLESIGKQTRAIMKAAGSIDAAVGKARQEIVALCDSAAARPEAAKDAS